MELKNINIFKMINVKPFLISIFILKSCYPVSHIITGEIQTPLDYNNVKVYYDYPDTYEKVAIMKQVVI